MPRRFEYKKMSADEFLLTLDIIGINIKTFSKLTGVGLTTVERWITPNTNKRQDIPIWVWLMLEYMEEPGGMILARDLSANLITIDNMFPELGPYPFLKGDDNHEKD